MYVTDTDNIYAELNMLYLYLGVLSMWNYDVIFNTVLHFSNQ
jgi:hypothetical protein